MTGSFTIMNLKKLAIFCTSFLITFVAFFWILTDLSLAQTEMPMQITVKDSSVGNGKMTATVEVKNPNSVSLNNLLFTARLMTQDTIQVKSVNGKEVSSFESGQLIADQTSDKFSL